MQNASPIPTPPKSKIKYEQKLSNVDFRYVKKGVKRLQFRPHFHSDIEMIYMIDGEATAGVDSKRESLRSGDLFLSFPNQIHFYQSYADEEYFLFIFKPELIPEFARVFDTSVPASPVIRNVDSIPHLKQLLFLLAETAELDQREPYTATLQRGYLLSIFSSILSNIAINSASPNESGALRTVVSYCSKNFASDLSLSALEKELHISKYYISHLFRDKLMIRFNDYIHSLRISEACKLLKHSDVNVTQIGGMVGFNSLRTFNRTFTNQLGISPSEFRKLHANNIPQEKK